MTDDEFGKILDWRLARVREVLGLKAAEYATDADRLHNFKRSAAVMGRTRFEACVAFMTKHVTSVYDLVDKKARGEHVSDDLVAEKVGDAINYLILLEALFYEHAP